MNVTLRYASCQGFNRYVSVSLSPIEGGINVCLYSNMYDILLDPPVFVGNGPQMYITHNGKPSLRVLPSLMWDERLKCDYIPRKGLVVAVQALPVPHTNWTGV